MSDQTSDQTDQTDETIRLLTPQEMRLLELFQRQDAMSAQLWQQFLFVNVAVVAVIVLISVYFKDSEEALWFSLFVAVVWITFTIGGFSALRNSQDILALLGHRIDGTIGDKLGKSFRAAARPMGGVFGYRLFHILIDLGVLGLCILLIWRRH